MNDKRIEELTLMDRFLFSEAMDDKQFSETVLSIIFDDDYVLKNLPQTEKEIRNLALNKFVRLDVWSVSENDKVVDLEVQKKNTGNIPKRSRHYQAMVDSNLLESGETDYNKLNDVHIIFIASFDLYGKGKYCYNFEMQCNNVSGLKLEDGATRIFLNTKGTNDDEISEELKWMLRYFDDTTEQTALESGSERIISMDKHIQTLKKSETFSFKYWRELEDRNYERQLARSEGLEEGRAAGRAEGRAEGEKHGYLTGIQEARKADAAAMKSELISIEVIEKITGLSKEEIEQL